MPRDCIALLDAGGTLRVTAALWSAIALRLRGAFAD